VIKFNREEVNCQTSLSRNSFGNYDLEQPLTTFYATIDLIENHRKFSFKVGFEKFIQNVRFNTG